MDGSDKILLFDGRQVAPCFDVLVHSDWTRAT
jgi:hypothetical protein